MDSLTLPISPAYRTNAPVVDALLGEVRLKGGGDMSQLLAGALTSSFIAPTSADEPAEATHGA